MHFRPSDHGSSKQNHQVILDNLRVKNTCLLVFMLYYHAESTYTLTCQFSEAHFWVVLHFSQSARRKLANDESSLLPFSKEKEWCHILQRTLGLSNSCRRQKNSLPYPVGDEHSSVPLMSCVMYAKLSNFIAFEIGEHVLFLSFFECFRVFSLRYHVISRAGWWTGWHFVSISCDKSVSIVITDIPSYHTLVLLAWTAKIFLVKFFWHVVCVCVHLFKVSSGNMTDTSYENIRKLFCAMISGKKMLPFDRTLRLCLVKTPTWAFIQQICLLNVQGT